MSERFHPAKLASFNRAQLEQALSWAHKYGFSEEERMSFPFRDRFRYLISNAEFDERGKPMDEIGKRRLGFALDVLETISSHYRKVSQINSDILIWSTQDPNRVWIEWCPRLDDPRM